MRFFVLVGLVLSLSLTSLAEEGSVVSGYVGREELMRAGALSRLDFRNAEVIIKYVSTTTPQDPALAKLTRKVEITTRQLVDYDKLRCLSVRSWQRVDDAAKDREPKYYYVVYRDGKGQDNGDFAEPAKPGSEGFFKYIGENDVARPELAGVTNHLQHIRDPQMWFVEWMQQVDRSSKVNLESTSLSTRTLPDGTKHFIRESKNDSGNLAIEVYDPKFSFPIEMTSTQSHEQWGAIKIHEQSKFETVKGFTRGVSWKSECFLVESDKDHLELPVTQVTSIEFQWLQFNEDELQWPDEQQIIADNKSMLKFLNPEK